MIKPNHKTKEKIKSYALKNQTCLKHQYHRNRFVKFNDNAQKCNTKRNLEYDKN